MLVRAAAADWEAHSPLAADLISLLEASPADVGEAQAITLAFAQAWTSGRRTGLAPLTWASAESWRLGVLAPELGPTQVLDALRHGRTWLTTDRDLGLMVQAGAVDRRLDLQPGAGQADRSLHGQRSRPRWNCSTAGRFSRRRW